MDYVFYILTGCAIYGIITLGYSIALGYTGLLNVGQAGIIAVGAYTAGLLATHHVAFPVAMVAAGVGGLLAGLLLAVPSDRIRTDYYALVTLGFLFIVNAFALNVVSITRGPFGVVGILRPAYFQDSFGFLILCLLFLVAIAAAVYRITESPFGKALESVRDDAELAASLGKPTKKLRMTALILSGFITGIGGGLLAYFIQFINPQLFWIDMAVLVLSCLFVGGLASFRGAIVGAVVVVLLYEPFRFVPIAATLVGPLRIMLYSLMVILVVLYRPKGLLGRAYLEH
jgi:branched-chain amino acid transport system permease protein